jgi:hypothetical protein
MMNDLASSVYVNDIIVHFMSRTGETQAAYDTAIWWIRPGYLLARTFAQGTTVDSFSITTTKHS